VYYRTNTRPTQRETWQVVLDIKFCILSKGILGFPMKNLNHVSLWSPLSTLKTLASVWPVSVRITLEWPFLASQTLWSYVGSAIIYSLVTCCISTRYEYIGLHDMCSFEMQLDCQQLKSRTIRMWLYTTCTQNCIIRVAIFCVFEVTGDFYWLTVRHFGTSCIS